MSYKYIIGTGYIKNKPANERQERLLIENIARNANPPPQCIYIFSARGDKFPLAGTGIQEVNVMGDLGKHTDLIEGRKKNAFNGWSGSMLALAMIAYNDESDLVFQEQDCLAFGPYIKRLYDDCGDKGLVFGGPQKSPPHQPCSQSLFLLKHWYIREFVCRYFGSHPQNSNDHLGESKFAWLQQNWPDKVGHISFGYDRERPFNPKDEVFYIQQYTRDELNVLKEHGLV